MGHPVSASVYAEIEIEVEGSWIPGLRQTHDDPGHAPYIEDMDVTGLWIERRESTGKMRRIDLLAGVDRASPAYKVLMANFEQAFQDEAEDALLSAFDADGPDE